jgi:hypothetical protein
MTKAIAYVAVLVQIVLCVAIASVLSRLFDGVWWPDDLSLRALFIFVFVEAMDRKAAAFMRLRKTASAAQRQKGGE